MPPFLRKGDKMKYTWKPKPLETSDGKTIEPRVEGEVVVKLLKHLDRLKKMKDANYNLDENGNIKGGSNALDTTIMATELAEKHIESVNLKIIKTGEELKTVEELSYSPVAGDVLTDIGFLLINGPELGNG